MSWIEIGWGRVADGWSVYCVVDGWVGGLGCLSVIRLALVAGQHNASELTVSVVAAAPAALGPGPGKTESDHPLASQTVVVPAKQGIAKARVTSVDVEFRTPPQVKNTHTDLVPSLLFDFAFTPKTTMDFNRHSFT